MGGEAKCKLVLGQITPAMEKSMKGRTIEAGTPGKNHLGSQVVWRPPNLTDLGAMGKGRFLAASYV